MEYISLSGVKKEYRMGEVKIEALSGVDMAVEKGELCTIVGPSGAGKTTLLNILGGMDAPTSGSIFVDGEAVDRFDRRKLTTYRRDMVGFVFQFYNLVQNLTALENVELAAQICRDALDPRAMLTEVGLGERYNNFPAQLSGGEQQRVAIARALAKNPKLLLCDEPTGALDYQTGKQVLSLLQQASRKQNMTVLIITHNSAITPMADRVVHIKNGRVAQMTKNATPVLWKKSSGNMKKRGLLVKNLFQEIRTTSARFFSIAAISMLGVAAFTGLRATGPDMMLTGDKYLDRLALSDIQVMSSAGLTPDDIRALSALPGVAAVVPGLQADALMQLEDGGDKELNIHLYSMPFAQEEEHPARFFQLPDYAIDPAPENSVNLVQLTHGRMPLDDHEVALDSQTVKQVDVELGDWIRFESSGGNVGLRLVGLIESPKYMSSVERGKSTVGRGVSDGFAYASGNSLTKLGARLPAMAMLTTRYTHADIVVDGAKALNCFSEDYKKLVSSVIDRLEQYGDETGDTWYVQGRDSNPGYEDYRQNTERISAIGQTFPLMFYVVAALVSLTTMTRMVEDGRVQIGTLKALGYSGAAIAGGYFSYAALATLLGGIVGSIMGFRLFPTVISNAYGVFYRLPDFQTPYHWDIARDAILFITVCTTGAAVSACISTLREVPAAIMRPKAPKPGRRVFLEYIGFLWKRMSFTAKVTARNLLRYKKRFWMSTIGIAGSCALMLTGFGLRDSVFGITDRQFTKIMRMQMQAFSYEAMDVLDWEQLLQERDPEGKITGSTLVRDKSMDIEDKARGNRSIHFMMVQDAAALRPFLDLKSPDGQPLELSDTGVIVTSKIAELYGLKAGSALTLTSGTTSYQLRVSGVAENYVMHYVFISPAYYEGVTGQEPLYNGVFAHMEDTSEQTENALAASLLADGRMYAVNFTTGLQHSLHDNLSSLNYVVGVLILCAAALAFVVMFNLTNINLTERRRELATLRVLGFYDKELYSYVFRENNALALIGALFGLVLGVFMHRFVISTTEVDIVRFVREITPLSYIISFALTLSFSYMVNILMRRKVRGVDMVESLKSAE